MAKLVKGVNDLATVNPMLAKEWHPTKNDNLQMFEVSCGSNKLVWWKCKEGHEWQAKVSDRMRGNGCPYCSGKRLILGKNDLASQNKEVASQWHPTKNGALTPEQVFVKSNKKRWWVCKAGHEWEATVNDRTTGYGCPYCAGQKVLPGFNDLATKHPIIAEEWNYTKNGDLTPQKVSYGSGKIVWWKCRKGHEWKAAINHRTNRGDGCSICTGERKTSFPEQAIFYYLKQLTEAENRFIGMGKEIDIWLPLYNVGIEYNGAYYHNNKKRDKDKICFFEGKGVRVISVNEGSRNFAENNIVEYVYGDARKDSLNWLIKEIIQMIGLPSIDVNILADETRIYEQYVFQEKTGSLAMKNPQVAKEWNFEKNEGLRPEQISNLSHKKVWWKCEKGHEWQAVVSSRTRGVGCPYCAGRKVQKGYNDLETRNSNIAREWNYERNENLKPSEITEFSHKQVWWKCEKGHEWQATVASRSKGIGCPICSGKKVLSGYNDLETRNPKLALEWNYEKNENLKPSEVTAGSGKKVWWKCSKGHEWQAYVNNRNKGSGCPICAREKL